MLKEIHRCDQGFSVGSAPACSFGNGDVVLSKGRVDRKQLHCYTVPTVTFQFLAERGRVNVFEILPKSCISHPVHLYDALLRDRGRAG